MTQRKLETDHPLDSLPSATLTNYHNKVKIPKISDLAVLEARNPKWVCWAETKVLARMHALLTLSRESSSLPPPAPGGGPHAWAGGLILPLQHQ